MIQRGCPFRHDCLRARTEGLPVVSVFPLAGSLNIVVEVPVDHDTETARYLMEADTDALLHGLIFEPAGDRWLARDGLTWCYPHRARPCASVAEAMTLRNRLIRYLCTHATPYVAHPLREG